MWQHGTGSEYSRLLDSTRELSDPASARARGRLVSKLFSRQVSSLHTNHVRDFFVAIMWRSTQTISAGICQCANGERYSEIVYSMMASITSASRTKRKAASNSFVPGFYRALNEQCSAKSATCTTAVQSECNLRLPANAEEGLPSHCFLVERLISTKRNKVI